MCRVGIRDHSRRIINCSQRLKNNRYRLRDGICIDHGLVEFWNGFEKLSWHLPSEIRSVVGLMLMILFHSMSNETYFISWNSSSSPRSVRARDTIPVVRIISRWMSLSIQKPFLWRRAITPNESALFWRVLDFKSITGHLVSQWFRVKPAAPTVSQPSPIPSHPLAWPM